MLTFYENQRGCHLRRLTTPTTHCQCKINSNVNVTYNCANLTSYSQHIVMCHRLQPSSFSTSKVPLLKKNTVKFVIIHSTKSTRVLCQFCVRPNSYFRTSFSVKSISIFCHKFRVNLSSIIDSILSLKTLNKFMLL